MNFNFNVLSESTFFKNIPKEKIIDIVNCNACYIKTFKPQMNIYEIGDETNCIGIILQGSVDIIQISINGYETIVNRLTEGYNFGNDFSCVSDVNNLNYIRSATDSTILFINTSKLFRECKDLCKYRTCLFENIIETIAKSNIKLNSKIQIMSQKTLRDKLITYFEILAMQKGSSDIVIPFNREQLASFLISERSSICRELSKLKDDNLISLKGNNVKILYKNFSEC